MASFVLVARDGTAVPLSLTPEVYAQARWLRDAAAMEEEEGLIPVAEADTVRLLVRYVHRFIETSPKPPAKLPLRSDADLTQVTRSLRQSHQSHRTPEGSRGLTRHPKKKGKSAGVGDDVDNRLPPKREQTQRFKGERQLDPADLQFIEEEVLCGKGMKKQLRLTRLLSLADFVQHIHLIAICTVYLTARIQGATECEMLEWFDETEMLSMSGDLEELNEALTSTGTNEPPGRPTDSPRSTTSAPQPPSKSTVTPEGVRDATSANHGEDTTSGSCDDVVRCDVEGSEAADAGVDGGHALSFEERLALLQGVHRNATA